MSLRKRSYRKNNDWLGVAFHNMRVDARRDRQTRANRDKRLGVVITKLRGEGIHESWADDALTIMEHNGYGLNQFSTKVVPLLVAKIRAQKQARQQAEANKIAEADRKKTALETRKAEAERRTAEAAERRQRKRIEDERIRQQNIADGEKRQSEIVEAYEQMRLGEEKRKTAGLALRAAVEDVSRLPVTDPASDADDLARTAAVSALAEVGSDLDDILSTVNNPQYSIHVVRGAVNRSMFFDYVRHGIPKCLGIVGAEAVIGGCILFVVLVLIAVASGESQGIFGTAFLFVLFAFPTLLIVHFKRLRRPRIKLAYTWASTRYQTIYYGLGEGFRAPPPNLAIPTELRDKMKPLNRKLYAVIRRSW